MPRTIRFDVKNEVQSKIDDQQIYLKFYMHSPMSLMIVQCSFFLEQTSFSSLLLQLSSRLYRSISSFQKTSSSACLICFNCFYTCTISPSNSSITFSMSLSLYYFSRSRSSYLSSAIYLMLAVYLTHFVQRALDLFLQFANASFIDSFRFFVITYISLSWQIFWQACQIQTESSQSSEQLRYIFASSRFIFYLSFSILDYASIFKRQSVSRLELASLFLNEKGRISVQLVKQNVLVVYLLVICEQFMLILEFILNDNQTRIYSIYQKNLSSWLFSLLQGIIIIRFYQIFKLIHLEPYQTKYISLHIVAQDQKGLSL